LSKETLSFVTPPPPKNYKISSAFSYNFKLALTAFYPAGLELGEDTYPVAVFVGENPEILRNTMYQDIMINLE
jgi:hypothetical protein